MSVQSKEPSSGYNDELVQHSTYNMQVDMWSEDQDTKTNNEDTEEECISEKSAPEGCNCKFLYHNVSMCGRMIRI